MKFQTIIIFILIIFSSMIQIQAIKEKTKEKSLSYEELMELINSPEFQSFQEEKEVDEVNLELSLFGGDECLMDKNEAVQTLKESYGIENSSPDENLRFILGKCNPVLLIPGIYGTKLMVEINCKE